MRVENFEDLEIVGFLRNLLVEQIGHDGAAQALRTLQVAAATLTKGALVGEKDQDLVRAHKALRDVFSVKGFAEAVDALYPALLGGPDLTPHDLVKAAAREAGHSVTVWSDVESLQEEGDDDTPPQRVAEANAWGLRRGDQEYRHGELLPVSYEMLIELRNNLAQARDIGVQSAGKLMLSLGNAAVAAARSREGVREGARRSRLSLSSMAIDIAGLVEDASWRLDIVEVPTAWERLDDEGVTMLALALPLAESLADVDDLLAMSLEDQYLAIHALGNLCKSWLERARKGLESGEVPSLAEAMAKKAVKCGVRRAARRAAVEPVVVPVATPIAVVVDTTAFVQGPLNLFAEAPAEAATPAEKPVCRRTRKPARRCAIAARRVCARRRCELTFDLFEGSAAAPGAGGKEGGEPARAIASRVIDAVRRWGPVQGLALGAVEPVERGGGGLLEVTAFAEIEGVLS